MTTTQYKTPIAYSPTRQSNLRAKTSVDWTSRTPHLSETSSTPSPVEYLENLVEAELYTWSSHPHPHPTGRMDKMESSWRDDLDQDHKYPASSSSTGHYSYGHGHGLHHRGPSELESSVLWNTSQSNGELGLGPDSGSTNQGLGLGFPPLASSRVHAPSKASNTGNPLPLPLPIAVWAKVMDSSKGRDKVLKCVQYTLRTYLYLLGIIATVRPLSGWFKSNSKRMRLATSSLSLSRKCLLLLNPLHPLTHLLSPTPTSAPTIIRHLIDLSSALSDDTFTLSRLGILSRRKGRLADRLANRLWLLTTLLGMWTIYTSTIPALRRRKQQDLESGAEERKEVRWTAYKLWADLVFVSYDVFDLSWFKEPVQCVAGLTAAFISTSKLYDQHWLASMAKG